MILSSIFSNLPLTLRAGAFIYWKVPVLIFLLFQFQSIFERFADTLSHFIVAVGVRVKGNGVYQGNIDLSINHHLFVCCNIHNFADDAAAAGA